MGLIPNFQGIASDLINRTQHIWNLFVQICIDFDLRLTADSLPFINDIDTLITYMTNTIKVQYNDLFMFRKYDLNMGENHWRL